MNNILPRKTAKIEMPFVSVILPVYNESNFIITTLSSVLEQDYPSALMEIIVADGMSADGTRELIAQFIDDHPEYNIRMIDNVHRIVSTGMNAALIIAKGDFIIRIDGHTVVAPDYVSKCIGHIINGNVDGVGGSIVTKGETFLAKVIALAMGSVFGVGGSAFRTVNGKRMFADTIPFPAYSKKIIQKAGLYDEELVRNQDDEYNYRLRKLGAKLLLAEDVKSEYFSRSSFKSLWKQYFQYGFYKVRVLQKHPRQMRPRQFAPPLLVLALMVSGLLFLIAVLRPLSSFYIYFSLAVPALYLCANLSSSLYTAANRGWMYLPLLPLVFSILHISYGMGFLFGLVRFIHRWGDKSGKVPRFENAKLVVPK